jgi:hypothetical protein
VQVHLRSDDAGKDPAAVLDDRSSGFIARGFDTQYACILIEVLAHFTCLFTL